MKISYDVSKCRRNIVERDLSFDRAADFCFDTALYRIDDRRDYGETRIVGVGYLDQRLHVICFAPITDGIRVISFRKANRREIKNHGAR